MKKILFGFAIIAFLCTLSVAYGATAEEAKALAEKAAVYVKTGGMEKALAEFNNPKGQYVKGDLYVYAMNLDGKMLANGGNPKLAGNNWKEAKDATGKPFAKEMIEIAKKGGGWVSYSWTNPVTAKVQPKDTYVKRVEGTDVFVACGLYK